MDANGHLDNARLEKILYRYGIDVREEELYLFEYSVDVLHSAYIIFGVQNDVNRTLLSLSVALLS